MIDPTDLHAYVDGELSAEQSDAIRREVDGSDLAAREVEAIRSLKLLLHERVQTPSGAAQWKGCVKRLNEIDKTKRVEALVGRFAPGFCMALFAFILIVGRLSHHNGRSSLSPPDFARMVDGLSPVHPPKYSGADTERWLHALISQSFSSTPDHLTSRGVKTGVMDGIPITDFSARDQYGDLEIFVLRDHVELDGTHPMDGRPDLMVGTFNGINCVLRPQGPNTLMIVADRPYEGLAQVAAEVRMR